MLLVVRESEGKYALNYAWLPSWIGLNGNMLSQLQDRINSHAGQPVTEETMHGHVVNALCDLCPCIHGLHAFLEGVRGITIDSA